MNSQFENVADQRQKVRRHEMAVALRWSGVLFLGFVAVTLDLVYNGFLSKLDVMIAELDRPKLTGAVKFFVLRVDDLGLRWITATILLITAFSISKKFKSWRPLNLSFLSLLSLNICVGAAKIFLGRCKARENFDPCMFTNGMAYPSGHVANALVTWGLLVYILFRYTKRASTEKFRLYIIVGFITFAVSAVSLLRNTHWLSDLIGGIFLGGSIFVLVVAIDRFIPSKRQPS